MFNLAPVAAALFFAASALAQNPPLVNTPINPPVCQPLLITWGGGTPPYFLVSLSLRHIHTPPSNRLPSSILPGNDPTGNVILDFGQQTGTQLTWIVNATVGASLGLTLRDSTGLVSQSGAFTVQTSTDQSCLNAKGSSSSGSAASTPAASTPAASTPAASTPAATTPKASSTAPGTSAGASSTHSSAASSAASSKPSSAATAQKVSYGIVGALGAAVVALLA